MAQKFLGPNILFDSSVAFSKQVTFDSSVYIGDPSVQLYRNNTHELVFRDASAGTWTLTNLINAVPSVNVGNIIYVSTNGTTSGQKGNPLKPFDISSAVNVHFLDGDFIYVYPGTYNFAQRLTPTANKTWNFYFSPKATINFGDASVGQFSALIGISGMYGLNIWGEGNFIASKSALITSPNIFEFNECTVSDYGLGGFASNTITKGNTITWNTTNIAGSTDLGGSISVNTIYNYNSDKVFRLSGPGATNYFTFNKIYSNNYGIFIRDGAQKWIVNGGIIDCSLSAIAVTNESSGIGSIINLGDVSVFGSGNGIQSAPLNSNININTLLTNTGVGIYLPSTSNININDLICSSPNYCIYSSNYNYLHQTTITIQNLFNLTNNGIYREYTFNGTDSMKKEVYDIKNIVCPSTMIGIRIIRPTGPVTIRENVLFKNSYINAGLPIFLNLELSVPPITFQDMMLYCSSTGQPYSISTSTAVSANFINVLANKDPNPNVTPLGYGIMVDSSLVGGL